MSGCTYSTSTMLCDSVPRPATGFIYSPGAFYSSPSAETLDKSNVGPRMNFCVLTSSQPVCGMMRQDRELTSSSG